MDCIHGTDHTRANLLTAEGLTTGTFPWSDRLWTMYGSGVDGDWASGSVSTIIDVSECIDTLGYKELRNAEVHGKHGKANCNAIYTIKKGVVPVKKGWPTMQEPDVEPSELSEMLEFHRKIMEMPSVDLKDPDAIRERIDRYLGLCQDYSRRPFVEGLASALKTNRMTLWKMAQEQTARGQVVRDAKALILSLLETWTIEGRLNPASSCFLYKNLGSYVDTVTIEARQESDVKATLSPDEISKQIESDIPVDMIEASDALPTADIFDLESKRKEVLH